MIQTTEVLPENLGEVLDNVLSAAQSFLAIDTETTWSDPHADVLKLVQFAGQGTPIYLVQPQAFQGQLVSLLPLFQSAHLKILQNGKFDYQFLLAAGIEAKGPFFDTMLASQVLCCGQEIKHNLGELARRHLGVTIDKSLQKSFGDATSLSEEQMQYGAMDVEVLHPLKVGLELQLAVAKLDHIAQLEFQVMPILAQIEFEGVGVDRSRLMSVHHQSFEAAKALDKQVQACLPPSSVTSLFSDEPVVESVNLRSPRAVLKAFESLGIHAESSQTDTLIPLAQKHPIIASLLKYRQAERVMRMFEKTLSAVHPKTDRLHGDYTQCSRNDGSLSQSRTGIEELQALSYFPLDCLTARPGYRMIRIHYEGLEMRVLTELSKDDNLMLCYQDGAEFQRQNATVLSVEMFDDEYEGKVAAIARGVGIHGLKGVRLQRFAYHDRGVLVSSEEAATMRADFLNRFPGVAQYQARLKGYYKVAFNLTGRRCQWQYPPSAPVLCQFLVYSTVSDVLKQAICDLSQMLEGDGQVLLKLDNQLIVEVNLADDEIDSICKELQESAQLVIEEVPIAVDWEVVGTQDARKVEDD